MSWQFEPQPSSLFAFAIIWTCVALRFPQENIRSNTLAVFEIGSSFIETRSYNEIGYEKFYQQNSYGHNPWYRDCIQPESSKRTQDAKKGRQPMQHGQPLMIQTNTCVMFYDMNVMFYVMKVMIYDINVMCQVINVMF